MSDKIQLSFDILVVGSGGTGTYFLKEFCHYLSACENQIYKKIRSIFVADGDIVEEKNLSRQAFTADDLGENKASAFCTVLNEVMQEEGSRDGLFTPLPRYLTSVEDFRSVVRLDTYEGVRNKRIIDILLVVGCVDNNGARLVMEQVFEKTDNCFLFDAGNEFSEGEVCFAHKLGGTLLSPIKSHYFPSLKEGDVRQVTELSCAELNQSAPQHMLTNATAAAHLLMGVLNVLEADGDTILERIKTQAGFVSFDTFTHYATFVPFKGVV